MPHNLNPHICTKCVLPDNFPGITFDADGVCNHCQSQPPPAECNATIERLRAQLAETIERKRNIGSYDCIVAYSGGKDSSYTLKVLVEEFGLNCLAVTIDNGFMSEQARLNAKAVTSGLGVDYQVLTPSWAFMSRMYRESVDNPDLHARSAIRRASAICSSCINLINAHMIKLALMYDVSLIAGGYIGGQVPKDMATLELNVEVYMRMKAAMLDRFEEAFGENARRYFDIPEHLLKNAAELTVSILNPMLAFRISEEEIISALAPLGWTPALDTGTNSSNCRLNDFGIATHYQMHGFNPYVFEISEQVRSGLMSREVALRKANSIPMRQEVEWQAQRLGIG